MERKQFEAAAASNHYLRGLLAVPLGMLLIASGLGNMEWGPFRPLWVVPACILMGGAAYLLLARYYNDNYGRVTLKAGQLRTVVGTVLSLVVLIGAPVLVQVIDLPVNGLGMAWASVALGYYAVNVGLRPHHAAIWGLVLVVSLVPAWGDPTTSDAPNAGLVMIGLALMATGVFDHRLLVRTFGAPDGLALEDTNAEA
jgi:hypothetical protein